MTFMKKNELKRREVLRVSNLESNRLTKECICTALLSLLTVETFDKITVTAIINRSGVSRAGFYRNYSSKEDVLEEIGNELLRFLSDFISNSKYQDNPKLLYFDLFKAIETNSETFRLLIKAKVPHSFLFQTGPLVEQPVQNKTSKERYRYLAINKALTEVIIDWFENGMVESPEEMADFFVELFHTGRE